MFRPTFVLTADAARARMFRVDGENANGVPQLIEVSNLIQPEARMKEADRHSDSMPTGHKNGLGYQGFDDHRDEHEKELRRRFAKEVASTLGDLAQTPCTVVACAAHTMYRPLVEAVEKTCRQADVEWHMAEYTQLSAHELAKLLSDRGHLGQTSTGVSH
jgi:Protein required for attachment to host cells